MEEEQLEGGPLGFAGTPFCRTTEDHEALCQMLHLSRQLSHESREFVSNYSFLFAWGREE